MSRRYQLLFIIALMAAPTLTLAQTEADREAAARRRKAREELFAKEAKARAATPHKAAEITAMPQAMLLALLGDPRAPEFAKAKACQRLAIVGNVGAVPALAALLADPKLAHYARFALEPIPAPAVDRALRQALGKLEGDLLIGVINSVGRRKDAEALDALAKIVRGDNSDAALAARAALGSIRSP